jgi:hypothetical protein
MAEQAKVTSIDALERFRASVILFLNKAHQSVDEVGDEVRRTRIWVQDDQRVKWDREIRRRAKLLDEAKQELMRARLSGLRDSTLAQEEGVRKAERLMAEAELKRRNVKKWTRDYDHALEPLVKKLEVLRQFLDHDMPKAIAYLVRAQQTLEAYAETGPRGAEPAPPTEAPPPSV